MQVPSGDPFRYQYQLSLNGKDETVEIWANTVRRTSTSRRSSRTLRGEALLDAPAARWRGSLVAGDGSSFGGNADWFVDFAVPVAELVAAGVHRRAADLDSSLYFPATSTNPNNYNKCDAHLLVPSGRLSLARGKPSRRLSCPRT